MLFDLTTGESVLSTRNACLHIADDWLHIEHDAGQTSIVLKNDALKIFITFLEKVWVKPNGAPIYRCDLYAIDFHSEPEDEGIRLIYIDTPFSRTTLRLNSSHIINLINYIKNL